jgi:hypothetical protein
MATMKKKVMAAVQEDDEEPVAAALEVPGARLDEYLRECVRIDPLDIQAEFIRVPGDLAYWNDRYADALREFLISEADFKILKAQLEPLTRQALLDAGGKTTEAQVKAAIDSDDQVLEAQRRCVEAEVEKNRLYGALDAIRSKKEMLISLGAHLRAEMGGDPVLRDQMRNRG